MQVINATTPAQQFHALRRQLKRDFRKPLICFTPKKLLRYPSCISSVNDFATGKFQEVIDDSEVKAADVKKIAFCSGKIYYDLAEHRMKTGVKDTAVVRVEQLYPLPQKQLSAIVAKYKNAKEFLWVQEEPENMGGWSHMLRVFRDVKLDYVGRTEAASPATGYAKQHAVEQQRILEAVFGAVKAEKTVKT